MSKRPRVTRNDLNAINDALNALPWRPPLKSALRNVQPPAAIRRLYGRVNALVYRVEHLENLLVIVALAVLNKKHRNALAALLDASRPDANRKRRQNEKRRRAPLNTPLAPTTPVKGQGDL